MTAFAHLRYAPDIRTLGSVPASALSTLKSSTVTTVPLNSCFSQCVAPMRSRSPRAISSGDAVRSSSVPLLTVTVTRSASARSASGSTAKPAFPHQMRHCPHLGPCARQHHAGFAGVRPLVAVPVVDQTGQRLFFVIPDMEPAHLR